MSAVATTNTIRCAKFRNAVFAGIPLLAAGLFTIPAAHAQQAVFDALTRTDFNNNVYNPNTNIGVLDFAGANVVSSVDPPPTPGSPTPFTKGRTSMGQSFSAQSLGGGPLGVQGFEVTQIQFYLWNGSTADGGVTGVNYNNIRANVNFWNTSTGEDAKAASLNDAVFTNQIGNTLTYNFTAQQVTSVNGVDGSATLITVSVPQPSLYSYVGNGDIPDDTNPVANRPKTFLGISISLQGDSGAGFGTTNDLSLAVWDQADYQQITTGKIAMRTGNSTTPSGQHEFGGFYRDYVTNPLAVDSLHQVGNFAGVDERSVQGTSFNSLALAIFGRNLTSVPEPSTLALALPFLVTGGMTWRRTRRRANKTA